jgi:hypothetical protein
MQPLLGVPQERLVERLKIIESLRVVLVGNVPTVPVAIGAILVLLAFPAPSTGVAHTPPTTFALPTTFTSPPTLAALNARLALFALGTRGAFRTLVLSRRLNESLEFDLQADDALCLDLPHCLLQ